MNSTKRIISITLILCLINVFISNCFVYAADLSFDFDIRTYDIFFYNQKTGYITDVNESEGRADVVIPEEINGVDIVGIGSLAFSLYSALQTVQIPDSITDIADNAFESSNPIIKCNPGSYAEKWAKSHGVLYDTGKDATYTLTISKDQTISVGESAVIMAVLKYNGNEEIDVNGFTWTSSNKSVVSLKNENEAFPTNDETTYQAMLEIEGLSEGTATVTVKYKDTEKKCKIEVNRAPFKKGIDGWSITNAQQSFGYPDGYKIPVSRYTKTFGISLSSLFLGGLQSIPEWSGNCFGLSILSVAQYNQQIDLRNYFPSKNVNGLYNFGYNSIQHISGGSTGDIFSINGNEDAIELIECALISQNAQELKKAEVFAKDKTYKKLLDYLMSDVAKPLLFTISYGNGGHAMVITNDEKPVELTNNPGWYYIPIYDCNQPSNSELLNDPYLWYTQDDSYLLLNTNNGNWQYWRNGVAQHGGEYSFLMDKYIRFYDISLLGEKFFTEALTLWGNIIKIDFSSNDISLRDENNNLLFQAKNGAIDYIDEKCDYMPSFDLNESESLKGSITIPYIEFNCEVQDGELAVWTEDTLFSMSTDGKNEIYVDTKDSSIKEKSQSSSNLNFTLQEGTGSDFSAINIAGSSTTEDEISLSINDDIVFINNNDDKTYDVAVENKSGNNIIENQDLSALNGRNINELCNTTIKTEDSETSFGSQVSNWAKTEMEEAYKDNLIPKVLIGEDLTKKIDRAEFAAISVQLYEELTNKNASASTNNPFSDIYNNKSKEEILKAYNLGITAGMADTTFEPTTLITREQLATMLCRTIKKYSFDGWTLAKDSEYYLDTSGVPQFADDKDISEYAKPSVYYMAKFGIIKGVDDTHFAPKNTTSAQEASGYAMATREQAIALSLRIFKLSDMWK